VMRYLLEGDSAAPSQIAAATGLQRTNLSTTLRGLEAKGLIVRETNPADGRGITVTPTALGRTNYIRVRREWATTIRQAAADDSTHLAATLTLLTAIKDGLIESRPPTPSRHPPT
jgi:DNA-binding MarR family transcriptional regulator